LNLALARNLEGRFAESREIAAKVMALYPDILAARQIAFLTYVEEGRPELALRNREMLQGFAGEPVFEAMAWAKAGQQQEALRLIRPFEEKYPNPGVALQWLALVYAFMGDEANTVKWLERSAEKREFQALNLAVHPVYAHMRNSLEFQALKRRMGLRH
jgi:tetratricopeptide (TPR) repeat protein